jgi:uncharacterized protein (TIGR02246 family)
MGGRGGTGARLNAIVLRLLLPALAALTCACADEGARDDATSLRLQQLEDREQIRALLVDYGATLDRRDYNAFAALFAKDAQYTGGGPPVQGPEAIAAQLARILEDNPSDLPGPNFHLSFNPSITLQADTATALSLGAYTAPDGAGGPTRLVFFVWYQDQLVREDGRWKFSRRVVGSGPLPATAIAPPGSSRPD